mmetsp:Transcript_19179/g.37933  ORF Transcript_19179/g.37933 Transcript_19179/m.37933 type:complete len:256 (-) Transcript_19179:236-1003(-)
MCEEVTEPHKCPQVVGVAAPAPCISTALPPRFLAEHLWADVGQLARLSILQLEKGQQAVGHAVRVSYRGQRSQRRHTHITRPYSSVSLGTIYKQGLSFSDGASIVPAFCGRTPLSPLVRVNSAKLVGVGASIPDFVEQFVGAEEVVLVSSWAIHGRCSREENGDVADRHSACTAQEHIQVSKPPSHVRACRGEGRRRIRSDRRAGKCAVRTGASITVVASSILPAATLARRYRSRRAKCIVSTLRISQTNGLLAI